MKEILVRRKLVNSNILFLQMMSDRLLIRPEKKQLRLVGLLMRLQMIKVEGVCDE